MYARVGEPYCPKHQLKLHAQTVSQMVDHVLNLPEDSKIMLLGPVIRGKKGEHEQVFKRLQVLGYVRVRVNGELYDLRTNLVHCIRYYCCLYANGLDWRGNRSKIFKGGSQ